MFEGLYPVAAAWISNNASVIASTFGSAISMKFSGLKTWREKAFAFFSGAACAKYLTPFIDGKLNIGDETCGFLIGIFGLSLCAAILEAIRKFGNNADFWDLLRNYILGKNKSAAKDESEGGV